ncbi:bestrophin-4 isoform X1 [Bradysia coprophila]|uniref:bestrophin-4 isoform X1 n=1 Tax=Bradysia coprophila TaxID=38358 RepID=UPI00187D7714|nr:bestrophin-4 isoform X1 [Bradysia coprophila]XP_037025496.1 bestrophin-4 isoform X1 [Bradysia coprophila]XP_037025497.1 bestrophin-4 isoform X1 [Bradysia coprophila]XP_037025499.1 bestrophin-4 isoform X1 [Bradysia coprophila]XP_037025500.1 bestrophin-4 isoform X1 [Bradysia coprophila]XP_037025501.1 bestrophin-4 isoform X1 [Bradysia coprophila]XP_037025502.1 bestrophin-4 isoform X1 [Bradysia coprophila]
MTVTYTAEVATCRGFGCFLKLLFRWRGSIYKLVWLDLVCFLFIYYFLNIMYRAVLDESQKRIFEGVVKYCAAYSNLIPLSFVLGFYVSIVMTRWWQQYSSIPWPDSLGVYVSANVHGQDDRGRLMRRTIMRYVCLCLTMVLTNISPRVKKRFPTLQHLYQAGLLAENEKIVMETFNSKFKSYSKHWMPIVWAASIITRARKEGRIRDDFAVKTLIDELNKFRGQAGLLIAFDTISVPLVYTQVVTLAVYSYFVTAVVGQQWVENKTIEEGFLNMIDMYFPIFTLLQFFFYMGWLKVAESLINPFGEDDDDFEVNWMVDRNLQVAYMIVDEMHNDHPELIKDQYWDEIFPNELPYTTETMAFKESHPMPSTANIPAALNARQGGKFDEMVGKSVYSVNYKFPDSNIEGDDAASGIHFTAGRNRGSRHGSSASVSSMAVPNSMTRTNTVASALKRFFSTDSSKSAPIPSPDIRLTGSASSASISNQYPSRYPAGSMKITDQTIEEVDEQLTITSMRANEPRPTAQSIFMPPPSQPVDVPTTTYMARNYNRMHSTVEPPTSNSFIFPMNNADMEYFVSASAPTPTIECPDTQNSPNDDGFDFNINFREIEQTEPQTLDEDDDFEKLRLAREKERLERQKQKLARSISTQPNQNP